MDLIILRKSKYRFSPTLISTSLKLNSVPSWSWASLNKSAIITVAILGYPPIVGCSAVKTIGLPSPGTV